MKKFHLAAAAGLLLATVGMSSAAQAAPGDRWHNGYNNGRHDQRVDRRNYSHNNYRNNHNGRGRCWTEWRHHRQVRVCR